MWLSWLRESVDKCVCVFFGCRCDLSLSLCVPQDAVCTLNTLQTNASCLEQVRRERNHPQLQLQAMKGFLERAGLTVSQRDRGRVYRPAETPPGLRTSDVYLPGG